MTYSLKAVATLYVTAAPCSDPEAARDQLTAAVDVEADNGFDVIVREVRVLDSHRFAVEGHLIVELNGELETPVSNEEATRLAARNLRIRESKGPTGTCRELIDFGAFICPPVDAGPAPLAAQSSSFCLN